MPRDARKNSVTRRELVLELALGALGLGAVGLGACGGRAGGGSRAPRGAAPGLASGLPSGLPSGATSSAPAARSAPPAGIELRSWFDFPEGPRSSELSGIAWDEPGRRLWAVPDDRPAIVALVPDADLRTWSFGEILEVKGAGGDLDLEGIVWLPDGFIVSSEIGPRILELDRTGKLRREIKVPDRLCEAFANKSLESLSLSPDRRWLFTANEAALPRDGASASARAGTRVRIVRFDRQTDTADERAYATDAADRDGADYGVADLAALGRDELLVLERGWTKGAGNTVRVYHVDLGDERASCQAVDAIADAPVLAKKLVFDVAHLALPSAIPGPGGARPPTPSLPPARQPQPTPLLDNYEGIALGPRFSDGRRALFLISDDNGRSDQVARLLVLAAPLG
jgi:hypothetical protein